MCLDGLGPPAIDHARKGEHPGEPQHVALALGAPLAFAAVERVAGRRREPAKALEALAGRAARERGVQRSFFMWVLASMTAAMTASMSRNISGHIHQNDQP